MWRNVASNAITVLIVLLLVLGATVYWGRSAYTEDGPLREAVCLKIEQGETVRSVSRELGEMGAVSRPAIFRIGAEYSGRSADLKAGSFLIEPGTSMSEIVGTVTAEGRSTCGREVNLRIGVASSEVLLRELDPASEDYDELVAFDPAEGTPGERYTELSSAPETRFRITLAEGVTSFRVAEALGNAGFLEGEISETPEEGRLAPGSYEVVRGTDRAEVVTRMRERQSRILSELWSERASDLPLETAEEALTLASIVEKETGVAEERPQVAGVFVNRLREGMRLQTDPSVIYGITEGERTLDRGLRQSELRTATPYNTYVVEGLPPTPIANPGREAIAAATSPAETDARFFVADGTGGHAFAETLAEHRENVARWREIEAERNATQ